MMAMIRIAMFNISYPLKSDFFLLNSFKKKVLLLMTDLELRTKFASI